MKITILDGSKVDQTPLTLDMSPFNDIGIVLQREIVSYRGSCW
jgi:hypothetical protein